MAQERSRWQQEITAKLAECRAIIRRHLLTLGAALFAAAVAAAFWLLDGVDLLHFALTKLEQPQTVRSALAIAAVIGLVAVATWWLATRLLPRLSDESIALAIERANPSLNGRLITAVQSKPASSPLGAAISERTQRTAADAIADLDPHSLLDPTPRRRWATIAGVLLAAIVAVGLLDAGHLSRFADAYLLGADDYWDASRTTRLQLAIQRPASDEVTPFGESRELRAARGAPLTIVVIPETGSSVPDRVRLDIGDVSGSDQTVSMFADDGERFRHTLPRLFDDVALQISGGDYASPLPYHVRVVPAPEIVEVAVKPNYPEYLGLAEPPPEGIAVQSSRVRLPVGTRGLIAGATNAALREVRVVSSGERWTIEPGEGIDGRAFAFPVATFAAERESADDRLVASVEPRELEITLIGEDGLRSLSPLRLTLEPIADQPPEIRARPRGIGDAVTRRASVPWEGTIEDDYGVRDAAFEVSRQSGDRQVASDYPVELPSGPREIAIGKDEQPVTLDLRQMQPGIGDTLTVALTATDFRPTQDFGSGTSRTGRSEGFRLLVVSDEELLAILRGKEVNLRQRFEQIVEETTQTRDDIREQVGREREASALPDSPERTELKQRISAGVDRGLLAVRKAETESRAVAALFADLRAELVNNRLDTRDRLGRIDNGVLGPLREVLADQFGTVEQSVTAAREAIRTRSGTEAALTTAEGELTRLVERLNAILSEMERRQSYNELIEELERLAERYESLREKTKERNVDDFLDDLLQ